MPLATKANGVESQEIQQAKKELRVKGVDVD